MIGICIRATLRSPSSRPLHVLAKPSSTYCRQFSSSQWRKEDPRIPGAGREIVDEFAVLREKYGTSAQPVRQSKDQQLMPSRRSRMHADLPCISSSDPGRKTL